MSSNYLKHQSTILVFFGFVFFIAPQFFAQKDTSFYSNTFKTERFYRIYLPENYEKNSDVRYPVIFYFHGWGGRYKWNAGSVEDDPLYPGNGRKEPPYVMEWRNYSKTHDVIIVSWDGHEPNLHAGTEIREGIRYNHCLPYDFMRAHDKKDHFWGWDFRTYFRELVATIDSRYRTIPNRDNRAITGVSMGGLESLYIAGQNKDLVASVSSFCPADNIPFYGPKGKQAVFPILEMYRALNGLAVRISGNDGDWLKYNDLEMGRLFSAADLTHFEFHYAHFPAHWAADYEEQLDFHMNEFSKKHSVPKNWNHVDPSYSKFSVWGYSFNVERNETALSLLENVSKNRMKILARSFIPDGPIIQDETINVVTSNIYDTLGNYNITAYNLSNNSFSSIESNLSHGKLEFSLSGGGHIIGINRKEEKAPIVRIVDKYNRDYQYYEINKLYGLDFKVINVGNQSAKNVEITASSNHSFIKFNKNHIAIPLLKSKSGIYEENNFSFEITDYNAETSVGRISLEIKVDGVVADTQNVIFFTTPKSPYANKDNLIILDGRTLNNIPVFVQRRNRVEMQSISGGKGNGNGIIEKGEEVRLFIRIPQGISVKDTNTFHRTYLLNAFQDSSISVNRVRYDEKIGQASATSITSIISLSESITKRDTLDLWLRLESLYNDPNDPNGGKNAIYARRYDYRRVKINIE